MGSSLSGYFTSVASAVAALGLPNSVTNYDGSMKSWILLPTGLFTNYQSFDNNKSFQLVVDGNNKIAYFNISDYLVPLVSPAGQGPAFPEKLYSAKANKGDVYVSDKDVIDVFSQSVTPKGLNVTTWGVAIYDIVRNVTNKSGVKPIYSAPVLAIQISLQMEDWTRADFLMLTKMGEGKV